MLFAISSCLTLIMPRAWEIGYTQPWIKFRGKSATHFVYFWSRKTLPNTHLEATSYIPQQGQSPHIWTSSLSTTGCYKNKYTIQFLWMACISRFAMAILSGETELALGTIMISINRYVFSWWHIFVSQKFMSSFKKNVERIFGENPQNRQKYLCNNM